MNGWNLKNYSYFRIIFGAYLSLHFMALVPWATELFGGTGALQASASPLVRLFPNILGWIDQPAFVIAFLCAGAGLSLMFMAGIKDKIAAAGIWFIWACLVGRNPLILNPGIPFVGWLLLMHVVMPKPDGDAWRMPKSFYNLAWLVMAVGYTYSGVTKLVSASWLDGSALFHVLESPLARPSFLRELLVSQPAVLKLMTFSVLGLEILAAPLALFRKTRPFLWLALVGMHMGILMTVDFADLTWGVLMIHVITFDPEWLADLDLKKTLNSLRRLRIGSKPTESRYDASSSAHRQ